VIRLIKKEIYDNKISEDATLKTRENNSASQKQLDVTTNMIKNGAKPPVGWPDRLGFHDALEFVRVKTDPVETYKKQEKYQKLSNKDQVIDMDRSPTLKQYDYIKMLIENGHEAPEGYPRITAKDAGNYISAAQEDGKRRAADFRALPSLEGMKRPDLAAAYQTLARAEAIVSKTPLFQKKSDGEKRAFMEEMKEGIAKQVEQGRHLIKRQITQSVLPQQEQQPKPIVEQKKQSISQENVQKTPQKNRSR